MYSVVDANNVDLLSDSTVFSENILTIGQPDQGGFALTRRFNLVNLGGSINDEGGGCLIVSLGGNSDDCNSMVANGSTLTNMGGGIYQYTMRDGTVATFDAQWAGLVPMQAGVARLTALTYPNGVQFTYTYQIVGTACIGGPSCVTTNVVLPHSVRSNTGYQIQFDQSNGAPVVAMNLTVDYCDPSAVSCTGLTAPVQTDSTLGRAPTISSTQYISPTGVTITYTSTSGKITQATNGAET
ncbi:MAG: hypothetical protein ABUS48_01380, partial [Pseudomonadota bacterium]